MALKENITGNKRSPMADRGNDLYETPEVAVHALLANEFVPNCVWEPCCGPGAIARVLRLSGRTVFASDIVNYDTKEQNGVTDFFKATSAPSEFDAIVTNPPFSKAEDFVAHGLALAPRVIMLLRLAFLESERRRRILDTGNLVRVHVFRNRLPMMHRDGWEGPKASSGMAFAWFVFMRDYHGPIELRRISWKHASEKVADSQ